MMIKSDNTTLLNIYNSQVEKKVISRDKHQIQTINKLDKLKIRLENQSLLSKIKNYIFKSETHNNLGIYLYSGVGRGKTMLMDIFFNNLEMPKDYKYRTHFHLFMKTIHEQMAQVSGVKDPLEYIIKNNFKKYKIICLDEFFVHDIADAMILANLLKALFSNNIYLITTSNIEPNNLYKNGLQRSSFLPAIDLLNTRLDIMNLMGDIDYRVQTLVKSSCYFYPVTDYNKKKLLDIFYKLVNIDILDRTDIKVPDLENNNQNKYFIDINDREIRCIAQADYVIWFEFNVICGDKRSQKDYIELAEVFKIIIVSNLVKLDDSKLDMVRRFIYFIDILYDYNIKLIINSEVNISDIYKGRSLSFEFERTISRLKEMQSQRYLSKQ